MLEENQICSFKLISGEEIIAKVYKEDELSYFLQDSRVLFMASGGELKLAPVMFSHDASKLITIFKTAVAAFSVSPKEDFMEAYKQAVSPIVMPANRKIVMG